MNKMMNYKGHVIAKLNKKEQKEKNTNYMVFTMDEWAYGEGFRYPEYDDCETIDTAINLIDSE